MRHTTLRRHRNRTCSTGAPLPDNPFAVADAPPLVPQDPTEAEGAPKFDPGVPDQGETIAAKRARQAHVDQKGRPSLLRRMFSLPVLIVVMLAILLGALNWRVAVDGTSRRPRHSMRRLGCR